MTNKLVAATALLFILITACKRESLVNEDTSVSDNQTTQDIAAKDLVAPVGFDFKTEKQLNVRVKVADAVAGTRYGIKIYADEPSTGKLISSGATDNDAEYTNTITVPAGLEFIYIEKTNPDGSSTFEKVAAKQFTSTIFKSTGSNGKPFVLKRKSGSNMNCSFGCNTVINNPSGSYTVKSGKTVCFTGTLTNVTINVEANGLARVCGSGTIASLTVTGQLFFLEHSSVTVQTTPLLSGHIINWGSSLTFENPTSIGFFENVGNCYTKNYSPGRRLFNYGRLIVNGDYRIYNTGRTENYGYFKVTNNLIADPNTHLRNNCTMEVLNTFGASGRFYMDNGYVKVGEKFLAGQFFGSTTAPAPSAQVTDIVHSSQISTKDLELRNHGTLSGTTSSRIKVSGTTSLLTGNFTGVKICDGNGIEANNIGAPSSQFTCSGSIPTSPCNPEGFNASVTDGDNDGVADNIDEYPNDAERAFNSYYPNANTTATIAFEDLWPSTGDYDFNDLVAVFNIHQILNADNNVVDYKVKLKIKAIGGSYRNGFGFQFDDLLPSEIKSIFGQRFALNDISLNANKTEVGQDKAVVICYDDPIILVSRAAGSMFNTIKTNGMGTSDTQYVKINFVTPIASSRLTIDKFNPFIYTNQRRAYEIHLVDFKPTKLAATSLFGTFQDRSNIGTNTYYKTANGMPWAMIIPEDFAYPKEKAAITSAYNFFDNWVLSGGSTNTNWFTNTSGNRNEAEIY